MADPRHKGVYQALALPNEALTNGGVEILRAGIINDELYVSARRAFKDPARWGEVLADIARRIALLHSTEDTDLSEREVIAEIEEAFAAALGAPVIKGAPKRKRARAKARATQGAKRATRSRRAQRSKA